MLGHVLFAPSFTYMWQIQYLCMHMDLSSKLQVLKKKKKKAKSTFQSFLWTASNFWIVGVGFGVKESDLCYQKEVQWFLWIFVRCVYWRKLVTVNRMTTFFILLWQFWDIFLNLQICNKVSFLKKEIRTLFFIPGIKWIHCLGCWKHPLLS